MDKLAFYDAVYDIVRLIPKGRVTSYGAIAKSIGMAKSSRMVGKAMNGAVSLPDPIPAHRVVNSSGLLTGKHAFASPTAMEELLKKDGVEVKNDRVVNFKKVFWDPLEHIEF
ncbi:MAG: MGMT family protein [Flavobacteriales bacterium]|nr:MGMT family protein [Flavobacteriales bacterium]